MYSIDFASSSAITLAAVGGLANIHEACLHLRQTRQQRGEEWTVEELFQAANPLIPSSVSRKHWIAQVQSGQPPKPKPRHPAGATIYPVLAGQWLAAPLTTKQSSNGEFLVCGAVFWHAATVGSTLQAAAQRIQHDICVVGRAGQYNTNNEPDSLLQVGGRIVGRMTWDDDLGTNGPRNQELPEGDPDKLDEDTLKAFRLEDSESDASFLGPQFMMTPALSFFDQAWPTLQMTLNNPQEEDQDDNEEDADYEPPSSSKNPGVPAMWSDEDKTYVRTVFPQQEYLAGRLLTTTVPDGSGDGDEAISDDQLPRQEQKGETSLASQNRQALHMIVAFTYSAPEQLDDAYVGGGNCPEDASAAVPIASPLARFLRTPESFLEFGLDPSTTDEQFVSALRSVSSAKALELLENAIMRNRSTPRQDRQRVSERLVHALYTDSPLPPSAPRYYALFGRILIYLMEFDVLDTFLSSLHAIHKLPDLCAALQEQFAIESNKPAGELALPRSPAVLLALAPNANTATLLLQAGIEPTVSALAGSMSRPAIFQTILQRSLLQFQSETTGSSAKDQWLRELAICASRQLHPGPLSMILDIMSTAQRHVLLQQSQAIPIRVPPPNGEEQHQQGAPPDSTGTLGQVILGNFVVSSFFELSGASFFRNNSEADACSNVMRIVERYRTGAEDNRASQTNAPDFDRAFYSLGDEFWQEFRYMARYQSNRDELVEQFQDKATEQLDSFAEGITRTESEPDAAALRMGRFERDMELDGQQAGQQQQPVSFHTQTIERYWFMEAARSVLPNY